MALLEVRDLVVTFDTPEGEVHAVNSLDFDIEAGEVVAIVGESGSGKSQTALALLGLLAENGRASGHARFDGDDLLRLSSHDMNRYRGSQIAMIFQDPMTALNPYRTIEAQLREVILHRHHGDRRQAQREALEMLEMVKITDPERRLHQYPHQLSGGMQQRVMIAMALLTRPRLLIADEPTTALDVTVQAEIASLLRDYQQRYGTAIMLITHDLGVVAGLCDQVLVMYAGRVMEYGDVVAIYHQPEHPYTAGLLRSVPRLDQEGDGELHGIPGNPPNLLALPKGCPFRERCAYAMDSCVNLPSLSRAAHGGLRRCHLDGVML
ncbi:MAG: ABC transporter ATP-binding protein [Wenzhouxiangellaceae bacterium]